jgi:hypothetical protein
MQQRPANAAAFGGVQGGGPQLRLLALIECGTHALIGAVFDGVARASEHKLARRLLHALGPGMLLLADRNFPGWELWGLAAGTGADLAWRIKKNLVFTPSAVLPDGSFLSVMATPAETARLGQARAAGRIPPGLPEGHAVRVIEYTVAVRAADGTTRIGPFRLATTLLDHRRAPAAELAALYHERWESENGYAELKTRLRGAAFILRSRSPERVCQELFAFLTVYQALCALETEAAGRPAKFRNPTSALPGRAVIGSASAFPAQPRWDSLSGLVMTYMARTWSPSGMRSRDTSM